MVIIQRSPRVRYRLLYPAIRTALFHSIVTTLIEQTRYNRDELKREQPDSQLRKHHLRLEFFYLRRVAGRDLCILQGVVVRLTRPDSLKFEHYALFLKGNPQDYGLTFPDTAWPS